ncbi:hypothetical protein [Oligoflexus tunisiensis]|uniref:hypothetical protein n=1 Tax=Oligoflexus tunisiensis TaxID=708132 RepID=UPI00114CFB6A|nr:hypothetical protein [Oligoflexus tunisiensis]
MFRRVLLLCLFFQFSQTEAAQILVGGDAYHRIGSGLESTSQQWRPSCLAGTLQPSAPNRSITMKMYASQSTSEILEDQRGYGSVKVDFWVLGAKARSEFILRNSESETQASLIWNVDYRAASVFFNERQLNARGQQALTRPLAEQRQICGDQFILGAALGARFYLATSLIFDSREKYRYFKTKVSASAFGGLLKKDKTSIDEVRRVAQGAHLSVQAFQYGGETFDLDLLAASQVSYCSMDNLDPCLERFAALHRYAFGPEGFRKHVDSRKPEQLAVLWLNASSYQDAGHFLSESKAPPVIDPGFVSLSEQLFQWNGSVQQSIARVSAWLADPARDLTGKEQAQLELESLENKAKAIQAAAEVCANQENYQTCKSRIDSINTMVASP